MHLPDGNIRIIIEAPTADLAADAARQLTELWWTSEPHGPHPVPGDDNVRVTLYATPGLSAEERAQLEADTAQP